MNPSANIGVGFAYFACGSTGISFLGMDWAVVLVMLLQAVGGLTVAAVLKYCDVNMKNFCTAISLILSGLLSAYFFSFTPSAYFLFGATLVVSATCHLLYYMDSSTAIVGKIWDPALGYKFSEISRKSQHTSFDMLSIQQ